MRQNGDGHDSEEVAESVAFGCFTAQPALYGWYLVDEPDGAGDVEGPPIGVSPETVQAAYELVKELDPQHPVLLSLNCMHSAPYYQVRTARAAVCCVVSRSSPALCRVAVPSLSLVVRC
jgi:hypothetical protein